MNAKASQQYLFVKIEAVNIYANLSDTGQISIIRGGGLMLRNAATLLNLSSNQHDQRSLYDELTDLGWNIKPIKTGASVGIYRLEHASGGTADAHQTKLIEDKIVDRLNQDEASKWFTFVVNSIQANSLEQAEQLLVAKGRFEQQRQLGAPPNEPNLDHSKTVASHFGGIRPATNTTTIAGETEHSDYRVTKSELTRISFGRDQRHKFYNQELRKIRKTSREVNFTEDLNTLADYPSAGNLNGKIAVFYTDANNMGKKIASALANTTDYDTNIKEIDQTIVDNRANFLNQLIQIFENNQHNPAYCTIAAPNSGRKTQDTDIRARLETLLWGGDEFLIIVPAWLGFSVANLFYQCSQNWRIGETPVTHAGGLVFCRAKTPIFKIRKLAQDLADNIKDSKGGRDKNYYDYMVLESVDYPTESSVSEFFTTTYGGRLAACRTRLQAMAAEQWSELTALVSQVPRRQLHMLVAQMINASQRDDENTNIAISKVFENFVADVGAELTDKLAYSLSDFTADMESNPDASQAWLWLHLLELLDYLAPNITEPDNESVQKNRLQSPTA